MALSFGLGQIDYANCAFKLRLSKRNRRRIRVPRWKQKLRHVCVMKRCFVTIFEGWSDAIAFRRPIPVGSGCNCSRIGRESDEYCFWSVTLTHKLAYIQLTIVRHVRSARIAEM